MDENIAVLFCYLFVMAVFAAKLAFAEAVPPDMSRPVLPKRIVIDFEK